MALTLQEIGDLLKEVSLWQLVDGHIERTFVFERFVDAIEFVNIVAEIAESAGHHPDIDVRYTSVKLVLVTHDAGGLTGKDFDVAKRIDGVK